MPRSKPVKRYTNELSKILHVIAPCTTMHVVSYNPSKYAYSSATYDSRHGANTDEKIMSPRLTDTSLSTSLRYASASTDQQQHQSKSSPHLTLYMYVPRLTGPSVYYQDVVSVDSPPSISPVIMVVVVVVVAVVPASAPV